MRRTRRPRLAPRAHPDENGFVIVWMTVVLVLLLSVAAFAVDLVHAYVEAERAQNAADAAALAGSTLVPNDQSGCANPSLRATQLAGDNGFVTNVDGAVVQSSCSGPNEMTVTVKRTFDTFFARIMGFNKLSVTRTGIADYDAPIQMGSAANFVGNIPECPNGQPATTTSCLNTAVASPTANLWANILGESTPSRSGNALTTQNCDNTVTDECVGGLNHQFNPNGETFQIDNGINQNLDVYIYDAGFVHTSLSCRQPLDTADWNAVPVVKNNYPTPIAAPDNTAATNNSYCSGDASFGSGQFTTDYKVSDPDGNTLCDTGAIPGFGTGFADPTKSAWDDLTARPYFRQWNKICTISGAVAGGEYKLNVAASTGTGTNQFSIMVLPSVNTVANRQAIHVFSRERLPLMAKHIGGGSSQFFMARVVPSDRQRRIDLSFFDLGDNSFSSANADSKGTLKITAGPGVDPKFQTYLDNSASACSYTAPPTNSTSSRLLKSSPPASSDIDQDSNFTATNASCSVDYDSSFSAHPPDPDPQATNTWDARWVVLRVTLPPRHDGDGFECTSPAFDHCWLMLNIDTSGSASLTDVTTWSAKLEGGPVRLVG